MPRELLAIAPRKPVLREYRDPPLRPDELRIRSEFSAPKHGTELAFYRGTAPFMSAAFHEPSRTFVPSAEPQAKFPIPLGNMSVGVVTEVGENVTRFREGDRVYGHLPIRETHTVRESQVDPLPEGVSPEQIVCLDPADFALAAVRDAGVRLGDKVAVFGMGAIGLMAAQMARLAGAAQVIVVDPLEIRRQAALRHGAEEALDPTELDVGVEIKKMTGGRGVDVSIEASGNYAALHQAIRCTGFGGTVGALAFYQGEALGLRLGEEFHMNRLNLVSTRACSDPNRDHPRWDEGRILATCIRLMQEGKLRVEGLIEPVVTFERCAEAYRWIDEHPEGTIKMGVVY